MKYKIKTFGCQMNVYESERISETLDTQGFSKSENLNDCDIFIINTCSVREKPRNKVINTIQNAKRTNPKLKVIITGCVAQLEGKTLLNDGADLVVGPDNYSNLSELMQTQSTAYVERKRKNYQFLSALDITMPEDTNLPSRFVAIQKGCNNFCAYCTVPMARGPEISRPEKEIFNEIDILMKRGAQEIYLLGQNVNSYKGESDFPTLLKKIAQIPDLKRIRFTTSHPKDLSDKLLEVMSKYDNICPWLHLPLQAGSNDILKSMGRGYTKEHYLMLINKTRKLIPDIAITTDIIVGFPGETEKNFLDTFNVVKEVQYEGMYSFKYSIRPNTRAAKLDGHLSDEIKSDRLHRLQSMHENMLPKIMKKYEKKIFKVLVEGESLKNKTEAKGRIPQNHVVNFSLPTDIKPSNLVGKFVEVEITQTKTHTLYGKFIKKIK